MGNDHDKLRLFKFACVELPTNLYACFQNIRCPSISLLMTITMLVTHAATTPSPARMRTTAYHEVLLDDNWHAAMCYAWRTQGSSRQHHLGVMSHFWSAHTSSLKSGCPSKNTTRMARLPTIKHTQDHKHGCKASHDPYRPKHRCLFDPSANSMSRTSHFIIIWMRLSFLLSLKALSTSGTSTSIRLQVQKVSLRPLEGPTGLV